MFKPLTPRMFVFVLMELVTLIYIAGFWLLAFPHSAGRGENRIIGIGITILFVASNLFLIFRRRRLAAFGFAACWGLFLLELMPRHV